MSALIVGGIQSPLFATALFSLAAAAVTLGSIGRLTSLRIMLVRALPILFLAALAWGGHAHVALVVLLVVSALGEPLIDQEEPARYVGGFGIFLAVRVFLAVLFAIAAVPALAAGEVWRPVVAVVAAGGIVLAVKQLWNHLGALRWPTVVYGLLLLVMIAAAVLVRPVGVTIAALVLAGSDIGQAVNRFLTPTDEAVPIARARLVWLARYLAQLLIVLVAIEVL